MEKYKLYFCSVETDARKLEKSGFDFAKAINNRKEIFDPVDKTMTFDTMEQAREYMDNYKCAFIELYNHSDRYYLLNYLELDKVSYDEEGEETNWDTLLAKYPERPEESED